MSQTVLIVDDEANILLTLKRALEIEGYQVETAESGEQGLERLGSEAIDIVLLDVAMPGIDGLEVLQRIKSDTQDLPVVMMSGHSTIETAVSATKLGAYDFVEKPLSTERLLLTIENALGVKRLRRENAALKDQVTGTHPLMLGSSPKMARIFKTIEKTAPSQGRVLITGENGTGKELVARAIHEGSPRADGPLVKINCAAIPSELIESELFGHEKGAFTGATQMRRGKFEQADGGTLFLDEIGDMSLDAQAKMLRVLQEGEVERVGGNRPIRVDVRVLAATNKTMTDEIAAGRFREDLYYRLNVVPIELPPLRERTGDIQALVDYFLTQACALHGRREMSVDSTAVSALMQYSWPGNVRELRNIVERCVILADGDTITVDAVREVLPAAKATQQYYQAGVPFKQLLAAAERDIVQMALGEHAGNVAKAAESLQLERSHLYKKIKALGIDRD